MTESMWGADDDPPESAFLDANVIRGQLTNDILLTLGEQDVFDPRWSETVLEEMCRNRPAGVSEQRIDRRIGAMNAYFPRAMTRDFEYLTPHMQADPKDRHVLAAAVHSRCDVLVTDNVKDFDPPSTGPHAMRVESMSRFLNRKLDEQPDRVVAALQQMVDRNRWDPRTMSELVDKLAGRPELRDFAQKLNLKLPSEQRGSHQALPARERNPHAAGRSASHVAQDATTPAADAVTRPSSRDAQRQPGSRRSERDPGQER